MQKRDDERSDQGSHRFSKLRWALLGGSSVLTAVVWLVVLPRLAERPAFRARVARLEAKGIDPSAIFYTEQQVGVDVLASLTQLRERDGDALWIPSAWRGDDRR